jgi:1-acyl-sn-glycerol-3-phosphate acyltransferase
VRYVSAATRRRLQSVPALFLGAVLLVVLAPLWLPLAALADAVRGRFRLPTVRLFAFGLLWSWLEIAGVIIATGLWMVGRRKDQALHYRLQRWWAARLMEALRLTTGIRIEAADASLLSPGPAIMLCRHASLADSLVSAWVVTSGARMNPRYVLKRELLLDPCLDIVGNRLPNHFLDRHATDSAAELAALRELSAGLQHDQIGIIFPEGTRAAPKKRARALAKIGERDPERAERLSSLQHLLPPRPAGSAALIDGCPVADVVIAWHVGFDGLDTFGGILRHLAHAPAPVRFHARRVPRSEVPSGEAFTRWLDDQWVQADHDVHALLQSEHEPHVRATQNHQEPHP